MHLFPSCPFFPSLPCLSPLNRPLFPSLALPLLNLPFFSIQPLWHSQYGFLIHPARVALPQSAILHPAPEALPQSAPLFQPATPVLPQFALFLSCLCFLIIPCFPTLPLFESWSWSFVTARPCVPCCCCLGSAIPSRKKTQKTQLNVELKFCSVWCFVLVTYDRNDHWHPWVMADDFWNIRFPSRETMYWIQITWRL